jgi:Flp pilus assembly pilin Flp
MKNLKEHVNAFLADEQGAETVEWVMIAAVLAAIIIAQIGPDGAIGTAVGTSARNIADALAPPTG